MKTFNVVYKGAASCSDLFRTAIFKRHRSRASSCLVQIYTGEIDPQKLADLGREIRQGLPEAHIIGATSAGEILNGKILDHKTVLSISFFEKTTLISELRAKTEDQSDEELGKEIGAALIRPETKLLLLFSTALTVEGGAFVRGIRSVSAQAPIAGGGAGDNDEMKRTFVMHGATVTESGTVGVAFQSEDLQVWRRQSLGWQPIGKPMTLDRVEGKRLVVIDGQPAGQIYDRYLGPEAEDGGVSERARECPLIIERNGLEISRIAAFRLPDGSLIFPSDLQEGEQARFSVANVELMLETASTIVDELSQYPVESAFIYSCTVRRGALQAASDEETLPLRKVGTVAGLYTYGEYFHHPQCNQVLNGAMTVVGLSEKPVAATSVKSRSTRGIKRQPRIPSSVRVMATMARLIKAVHADAQPVETAHPPENFIFLPTGEGNEKVFYLDIIAIQAEGNYTRVYLREASSLFVRLTMSKWAEALPPHLFLQLNRSLIIQIKQISRWEKISRDFGWLYLNGLEKAVPLTRSSMGVLQRVGTINAICGWRKLL